MNTSGYTDSGSLIFDLLIFLIIGIIVFFIGRTVMLWYWKINVIVKNQEEQTTLLKLLFEKQDRMDARVNYYKYRALGDNAKAYEYLLYMVLHDLTFPNLKADERKLKYDALKERFAGEFQKLGYEFPDYPY